MTRRWRRNSSAEDYPRRVHHGGDALRDELSSPQCSTIGHLSSDGLAPSDGLLTRYGRPGTSSVNVRLCQASDGAARDSITLSRRGHGLFHARRLSPFTTAGDNREATRARNGCAADRRRHTTISDEPEAGRIGDSNSTDRWMPTRGLRRYAASIFGVVHSFAAIGSSLAQPHSLVPFYDEPRSLLCRRRS